MQITIDTSKELSELDRSILALLTGQQAEIPKQLGIDFTKPSPFKSGVPDRELVTLQPPDWLPEMDNDNRGNPKASFVLDESPFTKPTDLADINAGAGDFTKEQVTAATQVPPPPAPPTIQPEAVPAVAASSVNTLPAHLRNRLPDLPTLAVDEDTDAAGVKWDATIHSETRSKTADGTWRKRRTAKNVVIAITDTKGVEHVCVPASVPDPYVPPLPAELLGTLPAMIPPPPPTPFTPVNTFKELMAVVTRHMAAGTISNQQFNAVCQEHGIDSLQDCFHNTALIPSVHTAIERAARGGV